MENRGCNCVQPGGISGGKFSKIGPLNTHNSIGGRIYKIEGEDKGEVFWFCQYSGFATADNNSGLYVQIKGLSSVPSSL